MDEDRLNVNNRTRKVIIGSRTHKDVIAGKNIRVDADGFDNYADYFTDPETPNSAFSIHINRTADRNGVAAHDIEANDTFATMSPFTPSQEEFQIDFNGPINSSVKSLVVNSPQRQVPGDEANVLEQALIEDPLVSPSQFDDTIQSREVTTVEDERGNEKMDDLPISTSVVMTRGTESTEASAFVPTERDDRTSSSSLSDENLQWERMKKEGGESGRGGGKSPDERDRETKTEIERKTTTERIIIPSSSFMNPIVVLYRAKSPPETNAVATSIVPLNVEGGLTGSLSQSPGSVSKSPTVVVPTRKRLTYSTGAAVTCLQVSPTDKLNSEDIRDESSDELQIKNLTKVSNCTISENQIKYVASVKSLKNDFCGGNDEAGVKNLTKKRISSKVNNSTSSRNQLENALVTKSMKNDVFDWVDEAGVINLTKKKKLTEVYNSTISPRQLENATTRKCVGTDAFDGNDEAGVKNLTNAKNSTKAKNSNISKNKQENLTTAKSVRNDVCDGNDEAVANNLTNVKNSRKVKNFISPRNQSENATVTKSASYDVCRGNDDEAGVKNLTNVKNSNVCEKELRNVTESTNSVPEFTRNATESARNVTKSATNVTKSTRNVTESTTNGSKSGINVAISILDCFESDSKEMAVVSRMRKSRSSSDANIQPPYISQIESQRTSSADKQQPKGTSVVTEQEQTDKISPTQNSLSLMTLKSQTSLPDQDIDPDIRTTGESTMVSGKPVHEEKSNSERRISPRNLFEIFSSSSSESQKEKENEREKEEEEYGLPSRKTSTKIADDDDDDDYDDDDDEIDDDDDDDFEVAFSDVIKKGKFDSFKAGDVDAKVTTGSSKHSKIVTKINEVTVRRRARRGLTEAVEVIGENSSQDENQINKSPQRNKKRNSVKTGSVEIAESARRIAKKKRLDKHDKKEKVQKEMNLFEVKSNDDEMNESDFEGSLSEDVDRVKNEQKISQKKKIGKKRKRGRPPKLHATKSSVGNNLAVEVEMEDGVGRETNEAPVVSGRAVFGRKGSYSEILEERIEGKRLVRRKQRRIFVDEEEETGEESKKESDLPTSGKRSGLDTSGDGETEMNGKETGKIVFSEVRNSRINQGKGVTAVEKSVVGKWNGELKRCSEIVEEEDEELRPRKRKAAKESATAEEKADDLETEKVDSRIKGWRKNVGKKNPSSSVRRSSTRKRPQRNLLDKNPHNTSGRKILLDQDGEKEIEIDALRPGNDESAGSGPSRTTMYSPTTSGGRNDAVTSGTTEADSRQDGVVDDDVSLIRPATSRNENLDRCISTPNVVQRSSDNGVKARTKKKKKKKKEESELKETDGETEILGPEQERGAVVVTATGDAEAPPQRTKDFLTSTNDTNCGNETGALSNDTGALTGILNVRSNVKRKARKSVTIRELSIGIGNGVDLEEEEEEEERWPMTADDYDDEEDEEEDGDDDDEDFETTNGSKKETNETNQKMIPPDETEGVRRSRRVRVRPLEWFRNERIRYERRKSGFALVGIDSPQSVRPKVGQVEKAVKEKLPRKEKMKTKRQEVERRNISVHATDLSNNYLPSSQSEILVIHPETHEEVFMECVKTFNPLNLVGVSGNSPTAEEPLLLCKPIRQNSFASGTLIIRPLKMKKMQFVQNDTMLFHIICGKVEVTIHQTKFIVETKDKFFVPVGNCYSIRNLRDDDAELDFVQIKH